MEPVSIAEWMANFKNVAYVTKREGRKMSGKLEKKEFTLRAIRKCRKEPFKGIHTVYSGFNQAWREYYGKDDDPVVGVNKLVSSGDITGHSAKGGFQIGLLEDAKSKTIQVTLDKILED